MATMKTEGGKQFPKSAYAYTPSDNVSEWKLRTSDAKHVAMAVAALGSKGLMGNRVQIPAKDLPAVKRKVARGHIFEIFLDYAWIAERS